MPPGEVLISLRGVRKDYHGLRPLRIERLDLRAGTTTAILGIDEGAAEVLTSLITAAGLPDEGEIEIFGTPTREIADADRWLRELDRFGVLNERVVLLDRYTAEQNLAVPFTLELEDLAADLRIRIGSLAAEVGLSAADLGQPAGALSAPARLRVRLGKALALDPRVLLAEHPNASLPAEAIPAFAADLSRIVAQRGLATLLLTADRTFAAALAQVVVTLQPATGELKSARGWPRWLRGPQRDR